MQVLLPKALQHLYHRLSDFRSKSRTKLYAAKWPERTVRESGWGKTRGQSVSGFAIALYLKEFLSKKTGFCATRQAANPNREAILQEK
jgi:hypothetical protein